MLIRFAVLFSGCLVMVSASGQSCTFGQALGAPSGGVTVFANCHPPKSIVYNCEQHPLTSSVQPGCPSTAPSYLGEMWECVEYVRRYYSVMYGLNLASLWLGK